MVASFLIIIQSLLTLAHYFDCAAMMTQCEALMLTKVEWAQKESEAAWLFQQHWSWLRFTDRYGLKLWRASCTAVISAADDSMSADAVYNLKQQWSRAVVLEIMHSAEKKKR